MQLILFGIFCLLFNVQKISCIDCYQCNSSFDIECGEKFDEENTKLRPEPCNHVHEARYCIKTIGMFEGQIGTKRFCSSRDFGDYCDHIRRPGDERDHRSCVFTCSGYGCNASESLHSSTLAGLMVFFYLIVIHLI